MYSDVREKRWWIIVLIAAAAAVFLLVFRFSQSQNDELRQESAIAIKAAVERSALQCYVVEGVYPPSLAYLEENYGLKVNEKDYYITYSAFASNLPPDVIVTPK